MTIEEYVATMRRLGIVHLQTGGLTLTLGPPPPVVSPVDEAAATEERYALEKTGPDGLTPSEQADSYGVVYEKG